MAKHENYIQTDAKKVSVIIPVYNSATHLKATFDSLACQTMPASDFEIICVNDCSTDNSREVIELWARKMPNLALVNLPKNTGGPMIPRNKGIEAAKGRYIYFLDSDDFLGEEALERLYNAAEKYHSDVIIGRYLGVNGRSVPRSMFRKGTVPKASLLKDRLVNSLAPHKMISTSFLKAHNIRFYEEKTTPNEDQWFVMQCYLKAGVITLLADCDSYFVVARGTANFTSRIFPVDQYFFIPHRIMKLIDDQVPDPERNKKIKAVYLNRLLRNVLKPSLFNPGSSPRRKQEWLDEGKKFLDAYLGKEIKMAGPENVDFIRAVQANDLQAARRLANQQTPDAKNEQQGDMVTARKGALQTYLRPSENALPADAIPHPDKPFRATFCIDGWIEVKLPDAAGGTHAVFVRQKDVRYTLGPRMQKLFKRMKAHLQKKLKAKKSTLA